MFDHLSAIAESLEPEEVQAVVDSDAYSDWDGSVDKKGCAKVRGFKGLELNFYPEKGLLRVAGALPSFARGHNTDLLSYAELQATISELARTVGVAAERLHVVGLELSVDTDLPESPRSFLESLIHHKGSKFCALRAPKGIARPLEHFATHTDYVVKFYDKGAWAARQGNPLPSGLHRLRYEVVGKRTRAVCSMLNREQVTLADLATPEAYVAAAATLQRVWEQTMRVKTLDFTGLKMSDTTLLQSGSDPAFWKRLKAAKKPEVTIKRHKKRYKELLAESDKRTVDDIYNHRIPASIASQLASALQPKTDTIFHTCSQSESVPFLRAQNTPSLTASHEVGEEESKGEGQSIVEEALKVRPQRCCQTCGRPIGTGNATAKFCSAKEVGTTAAKQCRNADSNPRNNARRALRKIESQPLLFDTRPYVRVPAQVQEYVLAA